MMEQKKEFDLKSVKVHRTTQGTILEAVFAILAVVVWGVIIWLVAKAPDVVPTHFDGAGRPNAYGSPAGIMIPCAIVTIVAIGLMITAYYPRHINMPFKLTNIQQVKLAILSIRIAGIMMLLLALAIAYTLLGMEAPNATPIVALVILLIVEMIGFSVLIRRASKECH